jgi:flagella basal body P-ring formation protein FlgA
MVQIPVLAERKRASDIIEKRDIKWVDVRESRVSRDTVVEPEDLIGMAARRTLLADSPIRGRDVRRPVMVPKGSLVMMVLRTPYMRLTVKAKALEDGAKGDAIRVANLQSKTIVEAVVTGAGEVSVSPQSPRVALK